MRTLIDRLLLAIKILIDVIFIILIMGVIITASGVIAGIVSRVFSWAFNLIPL